MEQDGVANEDADLDIFVYDPNGVEVATSTNGGSNEQIDIVLPENGTWTVWVHGWQAAGDDTDFEFYTWAVPLASGGSLTVDDAPASAVIGATEPVTASWTGATAGQWFLGAVSHSDASDLVGLTLVNVDNR